jgi:hypothetical protein
MSSQAQLDANRLNSQKSTGPTSPEGKAVSALNALKSGIHAYSEIIKHEDPAELAALTAGFLLDFHPIGHNQLALVDTLVSAEWTQRRLRRVEADLWNYRVECLDQNLSHADFLDDSIKHNSPLGQAYHGALDDFNRIQRRLDSTNRLYLRTLKVLMDLQALQAAQWDRPGGLSEPADQAKPVEPARPPSSPAGEPATPVSEPPSPLETQTLIPPIGFVPHLANATGKRPTVSPENPPKLKIGQWAFGSSGAKPQGRRPGKGRPHK